MARQTWLALIAPSILVVLVLWLPFGFQLSGLIEEWGVLGQFTLHELFFFADADGPMAAHIFRPLTILPQALAYYIDPNSFDYWHVLLMLALVVKGSASSFLALRSTRSIGWAMLMGMLVLVYPADTMQLSFRSLHINLALALLLLAAAVLVAADSQQRRVISCSLGLTAAGLFLASLLMYEAALVLMPLPFFVMYVRDGFRITWQRLRSRPELTISWIVGTGFYVVYILLTISKGGSSSYQSDLVAGRGLIEILYDALPKLFSIGVLRGLLGGWFDAVRMVGTEFSSYTYLIVVSLACAGLIYFRRKIFPRSESEDFEGALLGWQPTLRLGMVGMLLLLLGYAPYLVGPSFLAISQRTFLFAAPGAALVCLALLMLLAKFANWAAGTVAFGLLVWGVGAQLFQFHHYLQIAALQRTLLRSIVENFEGNLGNKTLVILDASNRLHHTWMLRDNLPLALSYLYKTPVKAVEICLMPTGDWQRRDSLERMGKCIEGQDDWTFRAAMQVTGPGLTARGPPPDLKIAKEAVVSLNINADGSISREPALNAYRGRLKSGTDDAALRYRHILAREPWPLVFRLFPNEELQGRYRWDFGKWWSLEFPTQGSGWREAGWQVNYFRHNASAWKSQEQSTLLFDFAPDNKTYRVEGQFDLFVNETIRKSLNIRLNGRELAHQWGTSGHFEARIPPDVLISGSNTIEFNSATDTNYYGLSGRLDWFEVRPD